MSDNSAILAGAIFSLSGTLSVNDSFLSGNSAILIGGAIFNTGGSTATVSNSILSGNTAARAGAIYNRPGSTMTVTGSQLSDNTSSIDGGAIFNNLGTVDVGTCDFFGNTPDNIVGGFNDLGGNNGLP